MAENDQAQEKTEEPTQRRLEKAREDGEVLSSKEMFVFASSTAGLLVLTVLGLFSSEILNGWAQLFSCLLYTSPSPRDRQKSRMPSSA